MNKKQATKTTIEFLNETYKNSEPPTSWKKITNKYSGTKIPFHEKHEITEEKLEKIYEKYRKKIGKQQ